jgi:hypothetical protein
MSRICQQAAHACAVVATAAGGALRPPGHAGRTSENDFNLNSPRYVDTFEEEAEIDLMAVWREREQLKAELARL